VRLEGESVPEVKAAFALCDRLAAEVASTSQSGALPIVLAGNCNTSVGTMAGLARAGVSAAAVCWFDAHADFHTPETTTSGFLDGMAVSMLTGGCWRSMLEGIAGHAAVSFDSIVMCGVRDVDATEAAPLASSGIPIVAANDDRALGMALDRLVGRPVYLHLDLDAIDVSEGRANELACAGGYSADGFRAALSLIGQRNSIAAIGVTAYDPGCDPGGSIAAIVVDALRAVLAG
jgi:arginase